MTDPIAIVDAIKLASSLGAPFTIQSVQQTADWSNALVTDEWLYPETPVPVRVTLLAYAVASRAARNPEGLESVTLSHDETSRTKRYPADMRRAGVYLTDAEVEILQRRPDEQRRRRRKFRTIHTRPGY